MHMALSSTSRVCRWSCPRLPYFWVSGVMYRAWGPGSRGKPNVSDSGSAESDSFGITRRTRKYQFRACGIGCVVQGLAVGTLRTTD